MADPSKLIESTIAIYGAEEARRTYGDIVPVPRERIIVSPEEEAEVPQRDARGQRRGASAIASARGAAEAAGCAQRTSCIRPS